MIEATRREAGGAVRNRLVRYRDVDGRSGVDPRKEPGANSAVGIAHGTGSPVTVIPCTSTQEVAAPF